MKRTAVLLLTVLIALLCACGITSAKPLGEIYEEIKTEIGFDSVTELDDIRLMERYYGINADMVAEFAGCINSSGVDQEEIVLVRAVDEEAAAQVKDKLELRYQTKLDQNKTYNPEQAAIIAGCSVERDGLYVSMIISKDAEKITEIYHKGIS